MFKLPAQIKLITVDVQIDLNCMESLPGALCVALPSFWFPSGHSLPQALGQQQSHVFLPVLVCTGRCSCTVAWKRWGFFLSLANNVNF